MRRISALIVTSRTVLGARRTNRRACGTTYPLNNREVRATGATSGNAVSLFRIVRWPVGNSTCGRIGQEMPRLLQSWKFGSTSRWASVDGARERFAGIATYGRRLTRLPLQI